MSSETVVQSNEVEPGRVLGLADLPEEERTLALQVGLARLGFSPGSIDGYMGPQTEAALRAFQQSRRLPVTGVVDEVTWASLAVVAPIYTNRVVTAEDVSRLRPLGRTWLAKSLQDRLEYETILELVAEQARSSPRLIRRLNPDVDWGRIGPGARVRVPFVPPPPVVTKAAFVRIRLSERVLQVFDSQTNLVAHYPCSIGRSAEKRPVGLLFVSVLIPNPNYTFNPAIYPESEEGRLLGRKLVVPPGPNNPVGTVWIGLDKPGYGIHGTPVPEHVGRTESHGCFRLANWNAEHLLQMAWVGMPVYVEQ